MKKILGLLLPAILASLSFTSCKDKYVDLKSTRDVEDALKGTWETDAFVSPIDLATDGYFQMKIKDKKSTFFYSGECYIPDKEGDNFSEVGITLEGDIIDQKVDQNKVDLKLEVRDFDVDYFYLTTEAKKKLEERNKTEKEAKEDLEKLVKKGRTFTYSFTISSIKGDVMKVVDEHGTRLIFEK